MSKDEPKIFEPYYVEPDTVNGVQGETLESQTWESTPNLVSTKKKTIFGSGGGKGMFIDPNKGIGAGAVNLTTGRPPFFVDLDGFMQTTFNYVVTKTSNEDVNNSSVLQDDDELKFAVGANTVWSFKFTIFYQNANSLDNIKIAVTVPTGATVSYGVISLGVGSAAIDYTDNTRITNKAVFASGTAVRLGSIANVNIWGVATVEGKVTNGTTAGDVALQFAQQVANPADNATIKAGSTVWAIRIS